MELQYNLGIIEAGCDEAGRGPLCGPVMASAVIFPSDYFNKEINDSKQLTEQKRNQLRQIIEKDALCFAVASCSHLEIDKYNILNCSIMAMHRALDGLKIVPEFVIVDGNKFKPYKQIPYKTIVKGDAKYLNIAAASILAKVYHDEYMEKIADEYPMYNLRENKGYPTLDHIKAIDKYGLCPYHRKSFKPCNNYLPEQTRLLF